MKIDHLNFLLDLKYLYKIQKRTINPHVAVNTPAPTFSIKDVVAKVLKKNIIPKKKLIPKTVFIDIFLNHILKIKNLKVLFYDYRS